jgi:hypothetical protein
MADLFLHLPFARRLRFAEGLHPLAAEAVTRRPSLVVLGACLAGLPGNERRGMSFLRKLFSRGGEAARWQKLLAPTPGQPHVDTIVSLLSPEDAAIGPLARLALGLGAVSHEILEEKIGPLTASLPAAERAAVERAQARLWLQSVPRQLEAEWRPMLDLAEGDANRRALTHVDRALKRVYGAGPGDAALARWIKGLAAEVGPLVEGKGADGALPPSLSLADHDARGPHFEGAGFVEKAQAAVSWIVFVANRLGAAFTMHNPERAMLVSSLSGAGGLLPEPTPAEIETQRQQWRTWIHGAREESMLRGRNPKPAFAEGEAPPSPEHRLASITKVMSLSDLPPESDGSGAPPLPETSGAHAAPPPPPAVTQEVNVAQIQAEAPANEGFQAPAHTQEVSLAQIEAEQTNAEGFQLPAHTQEVTSAQLVDEPPAHVTQPLSIGQIEAANAEDAARAAAAPPPPPPATEPPQPADVLAPPSGAPAATEGASAAPDFAAAAAAAAAPTLPHTEPGAAPPAAVADGHRTDHANGANGVTHEEPARHEARPEDGPPRE